MERVLPAVILLSPKVLPTSSKRNYKMKRSMILFSAAATLVLSSAAFAQTAPVKKADGILVNSAGLTVYTFDKG